MFNLSVAILLVIFYIINSPNGDIFSLILAAGNFYIGIFLIVSNKTFKKLNHVSIEKYAIHAIGVKLLNLRYCAIDLTTRKKTMCNRSLQEPFGLIWTNGYLALDKVNCKECLAAIKQNKQAGKL